MKRPSHIQACYPGGDPRLVQQPGSVQPGAQPKSRRAHVESAGSGARDLVTAAVFAATSGPALGAVVPGPIEATLGVGGGVCWWEVFQNNHRNLAGRGSGRWDLGLPVRGWGDAPLRPTERGPAPARPGPLGSGVWPPRPAAFLGWGPLSPASPGPRRVTQSGQSRRGAGRMGGHICVLREA